MCFLIATSAQANLIANGGFQTCNFSDWDTYTTGISGGGFNIIDNTGECQAEINLDNYIDFNDPLINTLSTELDLTAAANSQLWLSFDWDFAGFDDESIDADWFFVNFINDLGDMVDADGDFGFLIDPASAYGNGTFSMMLDSSLNNQSGWFLDFNVEGGFTPDSFSSRLLIDNVALIAIPTEVLTPPMTALLLLSTAVLFSRRKLSNRTR